MTMDMRNPIKLQLTDGEAIRKESSDALSIAVQTEDTKKNCTDDKRIPGAQ